MNNAVGRHLANCEATVGGQPVQGIFDRNYVTAEDIASSGPALTLFGPISPDVKIDVTAVAITSGAGAGSAFVVRRIEPDGAGATVLRLRK